MCCEAAEKGSNQVVKVSAAVAVGSLNSCCFNVTPFWDDRSNKSNVVQLLQLHTN